MDKKANEMFQLMNDLFQIDHSDEIIEVYLDSMNSAWPGISFSHIPVYQIPVSENCLPLKTINCNFGCIDIEFGSQVISASTKELLQLTVKMLSTLLGNKKQEEQYRALIENTEDIILRIDCNYIVLFSNQAIEKLTQFDKKSMIGKNAKELKFVFENTTKWINHLSSVFASGVTQKDEFKISGPYGQKILDVRIIPEFDIHNKVASVICSARDISELKQKEDELQAAKIKAEESDYLKSAFLANMSHEIRTPLNGILGFSQLLKKKDLQTEKRQLYSDIINNNGHQLLTIISDIIDISKIEAGQIKIEENDVDIFDMLQQLFISFQNELLFKKKKNISIVIKNSTDMQTDCLSTDEVRLKQVFQNLLSNAVKFTQNGQITFGFDLLGENIQFYVRDTGIGLSSEHQKIIFDRFRQANESITREYGGTGLGLAIARNLIELMGGKIWVESIEKKGTTFYFTLPLKTVHKKFPTKNIDHPYPEIKQLKGKRILVMEDDICNFNLIETILEQSGAKIIHVDNGTEAEAVCTEINPDLILVDIQFPIDSEFDAIQKIKKTFPKIKIIAITSNSNTNEDVKYIEMGCSDYLTKPVSKETLLTSILNNISKPFF